MSTQLMSFTGIFIQSLAAAPIPNKEVHNWKTGCSDPYNAYLLPGTQKGCLLWEDLGAIETVFAHNESTYADGKKR